MRGRHCAETKARESERGRTRCKKRGEEDGGGLSEGLEGMNDREEEGKRILSTQRIPTLRWASLAPPSPV